MKSGEIIDVYFRILEPNFPKWLTKYIQTPEIQRLAKISTTCGTTYTPPATPLANGKRLSSICQTSKSYIDENLAYNMDKYVYLDGIKETLI